MKRLFHILIPLLLSLLILISIGWYFLKYDPEFTRDLLLKQARYQDEIGNHAAAVWFYDLAYLQSDKDDAVALELAQQYIAIGNFTKAEYTLVSAIADGATAELYIALCRTYVEQDKLLDAVNMLDKVADPAIKAELDALRPAAPQPDFTPGFYSQYISLSFTHEGGTLYVSSDGEYPSLEDTPCVTPVALEGGETKLYALTVGDNGLVSPLSILNYTIGGVIEKVEFNDAYIEELVAEKLMFGSYTTIYSNDLWAIKDLTVSETASDLSDLRHMLRGMHKFQN